MALSALLKKFFGTESDRRIKTYGPIVEAINALEPTFEAMSDDELRGETQRMKDELQAGEKTLDELIEPAFALVREGSKRALGLRHFDVQLIGALVLHEGDIAEMKTGEGKTLVATLAVFLNALKGEGVHVVTVNDYLANRDAEWMGQVYRFLGLSVGVIVHGISDEDRKAAYAADVTYATNNELGFDYLRDNMKYDEGNMVQRKHVYAIVDEVDSILIDEARTPLIISGAVEDRSDLYSALNEVALLLLPEHFEIDEKTKAVSLTEEGNEFAEGHLKESGLLTEGHLYDLENISLVHHLNQALRAQKLFQRDRDYIVRDQNVVIIDEFTGRMMPGRRFSEGLHQALEAKEDVPLQPENQTLASVTFQNYFRLYNKLAGMTGTALTEAEEFGEIYGLEVIEVPTNLVVARADEDDEIYRTQSEKTKAILDTIRDCNERGQPILVGTVSIEKSEKLAEELKKAQIPHQVLNARHHEQEAKIIALAGVPGAVTIATNMAGRGTDIQLGGNLEMRHREEVSPDLEGPALVAREEAIRAEVQAAREKAIEAGGLFVLATERHESRRIDNQLRGRSGRQGDPGKSRFYLALDDDLMRVFGSERMDKMLSTLGLEEGEAIIHPWINKAIERAQNKVEARNYDVRKNVLKYDNVLNDQRKVIFEQRRELMSEPSVEDTVDDMRASAVEMMINRYAPPGVYPDQWKLDEFEAHASQVFNQPLPIKTWGAEEGVGSEALSQQILDAVDKLAAKKRTELGRDVVERVEKAVLMQTLDQLWRTHIERLEHLRQVIGYRGLAQRDPLHEYKSEAFELFDNLLSNLREVVTSNLLRVEITNRQSPTMAEPEMVEGGSKPSPEDAKRAEAVAKQALAKIPRNAACPCGSGKKFKHCHGQLA